jgi:hypothetical protein
LFIYFPFVFPFPRCGCREFQEPHIKKLLILF